MEPEHETLRRELRRLARGLPPIEQVLRASLFERSVRCGKTNCRCADSDDPGHPVVCVSLSLPGANPSQVSLTRPLVPVAETWIDNYRRWREAIDKISTINHELLRRRWVEPPPRSGRGSG